MDVTALTQARDDDINALCARHVVALSALGYYPNALDPDSEVARHCVAHLKKVIVAAQKLGLKTVNTFAGRDWTKSVDDNWPRFLRTWRPLITFADDHGIRIGIENCPMLFTRDEWPGGKNLMTTPVIWRRAFADIPAENFGLNYDPSHFVLQQMDPTSPLREFQSKLFHVHAKDVKIRRDRLNDTEVFARRLADTLVVWATEFCRKPFNTAKDAKGREHHAQAFTCWMAGGGVRGSHTHGETDDFGNTIIGDSVHVHDLHATILHLLGLDHTRLTYRHAGRDYRLTDVYGTVVKGILA